MKLFGAFLVIIAMGSGGWLIANALRERVRELQYFIRGYNLLAAEVGFALNPLEVAFRRVARSLDNRVGEYFMRAADAVRTTGNAEQAWRNTMESFRPRLVLTPDDWEAIGEFAVSLGNTDKIHQLKTIQEIILRLEGRMDEARQRLAKGDRLYRYAGFAVGIVLVLLLY